MKNKLFDETTSEIINILNTRSYERVVDDVLDLIQDKFEIVIEQHGADMIADDMRGIMTVTNKNPKVIRAHVEYWLT